MIHYKTFMLTTCYIFGEWRDRINESSFTFVFFNSNSFLKSTITTLSPEEAIPFRCSYISIICVWCKITRPSAFQTYSKRSPRSRLSNLRGPADEHFNNEIISLCCLFPSSLYQFYELTCLRSVTSKLTDANALFLWM